MRCDLGGYDVRDQLLAGSDHGSRGFVAGAFDPEYVGVGHFFIILTDAAYGNRRILFMIARRYDERRCRAMLKAFATSIVQNLRQQGFEAYLVGGCVRDLLLGREPNDYDVATNATPKQVMSIFPETYAVGVQFGVVLVPAPG